VSTPTPAPRPRVLVVVRDPELRRATWGELERTGTDVQFVDNEFEALSILEAHGGDYRVAVVDGDFRHLTGAEIAARITYLAPRTRVVLCTDRPSILARVTTVGRLAQAAVPAHLVETVQKAIARHAEVEGRPER
jgi:DNA-binding NtrC family response regulator